jgi:hypothetical protein
MFTHDGALVKRVGCLIDADSSANAIVLVVNLERSGRRVYQTGRLPEAISASSRWIDGQNR